jgi:hypothetical protein
LGDYTNAYKVSEFMQLKPEDAMAVAVNAASGQADINMGARVVFFGAGDTVIIWDDTNPIGEELTVLSVAGVVVTVTTNLTNSYDITKNAKLQNQSHFNARSVPSKNSVENLITTNEGIVDEDCHTTFKSTGQTIKEHITVEYSDHTRYPNLSAPQRYLFDTNRPIQFSHHPIEPLERSRDVIEIMIGNERKNVLDPAEGYLIWDRIVETHVDSEDLSAGSPITCSLTNTPMRLARYLRWSLTHSNITEFTLVITGTDVNGDALVTTITEADGWSGYTAEAYIALTSIVFTRDAGSGAGDELVVDDNLQNSRLLGSMNFWMDYEHGTFYPKGTPIELGQSSIYVQYSQSMYTFRGNIPENVKKMCTLLTAIDILGNDRYGKNLPGGEGGRSQVSIDQQMSRWRRQYDKLRAKMHETIEGTPYA